MADSTLICNIAGIDAMFSSHIWGMEQSVLGWKKVFGHKLIFSYHIVWEGSWILQYYEIFWKKTPENRHFTRITQIHHPFVFNKGKISKIFWVMHGVKVVYRQLSS